MLVLIKKRRKKESIGVYVPGTTAFIQGEVGPEGGWVVVSWVPLRGTSVDLAASHPESSRVVPISAIARALDRVWLAHEWELLFKSIRTQGHCLCRCGSERQRGGRWGRGHPLATWMCPFVYLPPPPYILLLCVAHKRRRFSSTYRQLLLLVYRIYNFPQFSNIFPNRELLATLSVYLTQDHPNRSSFLISTVQIPYL